MLSMLSIADNPSIHEYEMKLCEVFVEVGAPCESMMKSHKSSLTCHIQ